MGRLGILALLGVAVILAMLMTVLARLRMKRRLRERIGAVNRDRGVISVDQGKQEPTIRARGTNASPALLRVAKLVGYDSSMARNERVPWPVTILLGLVIGAVVGWRLQVMFGNFAGIPGGLGAALLGMRGLFKRQRKQYSDRLFLQLPDAIGLMIRAVQAGVPMAEALRSVSREMPEPTRGEFGRVVGAVSIGQPVDQAIWTLFRRTALTEYSYLAVTLGLQAQTGGSLAETLTNLANMIRKRVAMASRAKALASESKVSAIIMIGLPFVAGIALSFLQPGYISLFLSTSTGNNLLMTGLGLIAMGALTMRWLTRRALKD